MMRLLALLALICGTFLCASAQAGLSDCIDATCRIRVGGGIGSGTVFEQREGSYRILTNAHVAGRRVGGAVQCEFWSQGHQSVPIPGSVVWSSVGPGYLDLAVVEVSAAALAADPPPIIPLSAATFRVAAGQTVLSVGCDEGRWPTAWRGHITGSAGEGAVTALPIAVQGRSGGALFDAAGEQIVGVIGWHDGRQAVAMTARTVREAFAGGRKPEESRKNPGTQRHTTGWSNWVEPDLVAGGCVNVNVNVDTSAEIGSVPLLIQPGVLVPVVRNCIHGVRLRDFCPWCPQSPRTPRIPPAPGGPESPPRHGWQNPYPTKPYADPPAAGQAPGNVAPAPSPATDQPAADWATKADLEIGLAGVRREVREVGEKQAGLGDLISRGRSELSERIEGARRDGAADAKAIARSVSLQIVQERISSAGGGWAWGKLLATVFGLSGPPALALSLGAWFIGRRLRRRLSPRAADRPKITVVPAAAGRRHKPTSNGIATSIPPQVVRHEQDYVPYERPNGQLEALLAAMREHATKYPGSVPTIEALQAKAKQILAGSPPAADTRK